MREVAGLFTWFVAGKEFVFELDASQSKLKAGTHITKKGKENPTLWALCYRSQLLLS